MQLDADEDGSPLHGNFAAAATQQQQQQAQGDQLQQEDHHDQPLPAGNGPEAEHSGISESQDALAASAEGHGDSGHGGENGDGPEGEKRLSVSSGQGRYSCYRAAIQSKS